jgi:hypothetical protein
MSGTGPTGQPTPERRATPRTRLQRLAYIRVEPANGAIVVDATGVGIRFYAVAPLHQDGTIRFSFSLPGNRRVEAAARLVWTDETKKSGGLEFSSVPAEVVEQILDCCLAPSFTLHNDQRRMLPVAPPNELASSERLPMPSLTPVIPTDFKDGCTSLIAVPALAGAGKISRVAAQRPLQDSEAWKKWLRQMPLVEWLRAAPIRKRPRNAVAKTALPAFLVAVLFFLPILFLPRFVTMVMHVTVPAAAPQTPAPLPPVVQAGSQQPPGELIASPQRVPRKANSV